MGIGSGASILGGGIFGLGSRKKPGENKIKELLQQYQSLSNAERAQLSELELAESYVKPMFRALGWGISPESAEGPGKPASTDFDLTYEDLVVPVEVKKPGGSPSRLKPAKWPEDADWGIGTDFETVRIWDLRGPGRPSVHLDSGPEQYLNDEDEQQDVLAAEVFYESLG